MTREVCELRGEAGGQVLLRVGKRWKPVALDQGSTVPMAPGSPALALSEILDAYQSAQANAQVLGGVFDLDTQRRIGEHLYSAIEGDRLFAPGDKKDRWLEIVVSGDAQTRRDIERLPWGMLAKPQFGEPFLARNRDHDWFISINSGQREKAARMPQQPKILIMMPNSEGSGWQQHKQEINRRIGATYGKSLYETNVRWASKWREVQAILASGFLPKITYFYGHGWTNEDGSTVIEFEDVTPSTAAFRQVIDELPSLDVPQVMIFNNCNGTSAPFLGFGEHLAGLVPCLIANRTIAVVDDAQAIGAYLLEQFVLAGAAPDRIFNDAVRAALAMGVGGEAGGRWACATVYTRYESWSTTSGERPRQFSPRSAGDFPNLLNRDTTVGLATRELESLLVPQAATSGTRPSVALSALVWQAEPGQGLIAFRKRLEDLIEEKFPRHVLRPVTIDPEIDETAGRPKSVEDLESHLRLGLQQEIENSKLDHYLKTKLKVALDPRGAAGGIIAGLQRRLVSEPTILLIHHPPLPKSEEQSLGIYWKLFTTLAATLAEGADKGTNLRIVLGLPIDLGPARRGPGKRYLLDIGETFPRGKGKAASVTDLGQLLPVEAGDVAKHLLRFHAFYEQVDVVSDARLVLGGDRGDFDPTVEILREKAGLAGG